MPPKIDEEIFEWLGEELEPPPPPPPPVKNKKWMPRQTRKQRELFLCWQKFILCWGPKGSGKSLGVLDKLVQHCYDNKNAFALIVVVVQNMAVKGGAWDILINEVLPRWKHGNWNVKDPTREQKIDRGLGLNYTDVKYDPNHCPYIWIQNKHGGWSMATVLSCPNPNQLRMRIRGVVPSFVFLDEATSCSGPEYLESVAAQLGRRPLVEGVQQFIAACNPEDPDNWVYLKWFIECYDEHGHKDSNYTDIYFPAEDNKENLPEGYIEGLTSVYGRNATEAARMIGGEWVASPSGDALFSETYNPTVHVRPLDAQMKPSDTEWLMPSAAYPLILGIDPGSVYNVFIFMQRLPIDECLKWLIFDEIVILRKRIGYMQLIPAVMRRIRFWRDLVAFEMPQVWISDESAFNVFRPTSGTFDNLAIEKVYEAERAKLNLERMRMRACPKFQGSVEARITIAQTVLAEDEIVISARCRHVQRMFLRLESEKQVSGKPFDPKLATTPKRSDHIHTFDAMTYPMLAGATKPQLLIPPKTGGGGSTLISVHGHAA